MDIRQIEDSINNGDYLKFVEILGQIDKFKDPCHPCYVIDKIVERFAGDKRNKWLSTVLSSDLYVWLCNFKWGGLDEMYRITSSIIMLQQEELTEKILSKIKLMRMDRNLPQYVYESFAKYNLGLLDHYLALYPTKNNIIGSLRGLIQVGNTEKIEQIIARHGCEKYLLSHDCLSSAVCCGNSIENVKYITRLKNFAHEHIESLFELSAYFRKSDTLEWLCQNYLDGQKNLLGIAFDSVGKYGTGHCEECYKIILRYGYDDHEAINSKLIGIYPHLINFEAISKDESLEVDDEEYMKCFGIITPYMKSRGVESEASMAGDTLSESGKGFYKALYGLHYDGECKPKCFSLRTLLNIIEDDGEAQKYGRYRYWAENEIFNTVVHENETGSYHPTDYPVGYLMVGILLRNNWFYLCKDDLRKFCKSYGIYDIEKFGQIFEEQKKMLVEIYDDCHEEFKVRGFDTLKLLIKDMDATTTSLF